MMRQQRQTEAIWQNESTAALIGRATRYQLELPVRYRRSGAAQWRQGKTSNISRSGVLFCSEDGNDSPAPGSVLELLLTLAPEGEPAMAEVLCLGPVVRQAPCGESATELAVRIVRYQMVASEIVDEG